MKTLNANTHKVGKEMRLHYIVTQDRPSKGKKVSTCISQLKEAAVVSTVLKG